LKQFLKRLEGCGEKHRLILTEAADEAVTGRD